MSLLTICQWVQSTPLSEAIRESIWVFPILEAVHVFAITWLVGMIWLLDLRLLGLGLRRESVREVVSRILPLAWGGFAVSVLSGGLILWSEPVRLYGSGAFRIKMALLLLAGVNALLFHLTSYRAVPAWGRIIGLLSIVFWTGIVISGRAVGYKF